MLGHRRVKDEIEDYVEHELRHTVMVEDDRGRQWEAFAVGFHRGRLTWILTKGVGNRATFRKDMTPDECKHEELDVELSA